MVENPGSTAVEATPLWFGPDDRPLFGWLHTPVGGVVRGGVVLCQPLGIEAICTYFSYRLLAEELAGRGLAVLRFDYDGTGDSAGNETDPDRLDAWLDSVSAATDFLLDSGVPRCGLLGIRMGGLFAAAQACRRGGVDALVLWDTCLSGRSFLREQRFLRLLSGTGHDQVAEAEGEPGDEAVEAPGLRIEPETVKALSDLDLGRMAGTLATRTLVLTPPGSSRPRRLERRLEGTGVDWQEATGQSDLLNGYCRDDQCESRKACPGQAPKPDHQQEQYEDRGSEAHCVQLDDGTGLDESGRGNHSPVGGNVEAVPVGAQGRGVTSAADRKELEKADQERCESHACEIAQPAEIAPEHLSDPETQKDAWGQEESRVAQEGGQPQDNPECYEPTP